MRKTFNILLLSLLFFLAIGCATIGTPSGGPRDEDPPRFVSANPAPGSLNFSGRRATIRFDELVNVKDAFSKVVISPTSAQTPRVTSQGRNVFIDFQDTLMPNTTYTVDFGNSIEDNNEGNKLPSFAYTFSTGDEIDTLQISGMVLAARDLEPQQGMLVGIHSWPSDTIAPGDTLFKNVRLQRIAKTDDRGRFTVRGLAPGNYRLFALADVNNDYRWDNPQEDIAFTSFTISPWAEPTMATDTVWNLLTGKVDSVISRPRTRYMPNDILLSSFNIDYRQQYLTKAERTDSLRLSVIFNAPADSLPAIRLLKPERVSSEPNDWFVADRNLTADTLTYWISDPQLIRSDTILAELKYLATDSAKMLSLTTDTIKFIKPKVRARNNASSAKKSANNQKVKDQSVAADSTQVKLLDMNIQASAAHDIRQPLVVEFPEPLQTLNPRAFHMEVKPDSVWKPVDRPFRIEPFDSVSVRRFKIDYPWDYGASYKLSVDSLAATGLYGLSTGPVSKEFTIKKESDYFNVTFTISGLDTIPGFVELLDGSDKPVRTALVVNGKADFKDVPLGTYYARLVEDRNGNGLYDTGSYDEDRQPEYVYYYPKALKMTKRWDLEQPWNILERAIDQQKPSAVKKNKPEADKRKKNPNSGTESEEDEIFDPSANPFDPNDKANRRNTQRTGMF